MGKKQKSENEIAKTVDKLVKDVNTDRDTVVNFLQQLIQNYGGESSAGIAEYVAKLTDALTRQHQVRVAALKAITKEAHGAADDELDDINSEIGMPFQVEDHTSEN